MDNRPTELLPSNPNAKIQPQVRQQKQLATAGGQVIVQIWLFFFYSNWPAHISATTPTSQQFADSFSWNQKPANTRKKKLKDTIDMDAMRSVPWYFELPSAKLVLSVISYSVFMFA